MSGLIEAGAAKGPLSRSALGRIVVARFLALPLASFERQVAALEASPLFRALLPAIGIGSLSRSEPADTNAGVVAVVMRRGDATFRYASRTFDREYLLDESAILQSGGGAGRMQLIGQLRLINTRNRLTHALLCSIIAAQQRYLATADPLHLVSFSQRALSSRLRLDGACEVDADPSRLSRLLRGLSIQTPGASIVKLSSLCATPQYLHRLYVGQVLKEERLRMVADLEGETLSDGKIARVIERRFGASILPRSVTHIRRRLGVPDSRARRLRSAYLAATVDFSPLWTLSEESLRTHVPSCPGVYELRSERQTPGPCPILYVGSAGDMRKRLAHHLRGYSDNFQLQQYVQGGVSFRYRMVAEHWRRIERAIYAAFCDTFGEPPACNRMSP